MSVMEKIYLRIKAINYEAGRAISRLFHFIIETIIEILITAFETARILIYKVLSLVTVFTTIGFLVAIVYLILNIKEAAGGVLFTDTKHFASMIVLSVIHVVCFTLMKIIRPKYL